MEAIPLHRYGVIDFTRLDVRGVACLSLDMRAETGCPHKVADESGLAPAGTFSLSVCAHREAGAPPIGEVRIWLGGREVRVVGALTGRPGVVEVTPDHLQGSLSDPAYRTRMREWLGLAA